MNQVNHIESKNQSSSGQSSNNSMSDRPYNPTLRIVIAESNPIVLQRLLQTVQDIGKWNIYICGEYTELIETMSFGSTDLLLLGNVDQSSCFEIYRICHQEWKDLPVIMVSHDAVIPDFYRNWIMEKKGFNDVVSSDPANHNQFVKVIQNVTSVIRAQKQALSLSSSAPSLKGDAIALTIDGKSTKSAKGTRLLSALLSNHAKILKACGGQGRCATCHVFVQEGMECLTPPTEQELITLNLMRIEKSNARLACQCKILEAGLVVEIPKGKYVGSEAELESLVGKKAQQSLIHPITGETLVYEGKLILRSALQRMQEVDREFEREMGTLLTRSAIK
ncbi:2Fe-2S iron-sulfur cluster-binding protein [Pseudanabaena sp. lw0831]|uniref:2Fe-2S iron-sulfur cluster-binding protein n=1 Tax=Pseudanabaena sp. lw0831 TaxID=1357935 RepID=UPI001F1E94B2|nr:2Fe-2S iron-sulfur cluster-binding protein [Pseudanabaena sp. lw0831]